MIAFAFMKAGQVLFHLVAVVALFVANTSDRIGQSCRRKAEEARARRRHQAAYRQAQRIALATVLRDNEDAAARQHSDEAHRLQVRLHEAAIAARRHREAATGYDELIGRMRSAA